MPRGTTHTIEGLLLAGTIYPVIRADDGGQWRLNHPSGLQRLIGRRVRVRGIRSSVDLLEVIEGELL